MGCAPALSSMQPAHVAPKHHVQVEVGTDVSIPTGVISDLLDVVKPVLKAADQRELTDAEVQQIYKAGASTLLNAPGPVTHVGVAFTVVDNLEVSLRYASSSIRLGGRYQFLQKDKHKVDATIGLGLGYYVFSFPLGETFDPFLTLEDFKRFQLDVPLVFGTHGNWYRVWGGPRFMYTRFGTELNLNLLPIPGVSAGRKELASFGGNAFYVGGQAGVALGYKYVFLAFELTVARLIMNSDLVVLDKPVANFDLGSTIVYPALGLMGEF